MKKLALVLSMLALAAVLVTLILKPSRPKMRRSADSDEPVPADVPKVTEEYVDAPKLDKEFYDKKGRIIGRRFLGGYHVLSQYILPGMPQVELQFFRRRGDALEPWNPRDFGTPAKSKPIGAHRLRSELYGGYDLESVETPTNRIRIGCATTDQANEIGGPYVIFGRSYALVFTLNRDLQSVNGHFSTHQYILKVPERIPADKLMVVKIVMDDIEVKRSVEDTPTIDGKVAVPAGSDASAMQVIYQLKVDGYCERSKLRPDGAFSLPADELGGSLCVLGENAPLGCSLYYVGKVDKRSYTFPGDEDLAGHSKLLKLKIHIPEHYVKLHEKSRRLAVCLYPSRTNALPFSVAKVYSDDWDSFLKDRVVGMDAVPGTFVVRIGMEWASTITIDASPATHDITIP